MDRRTEERLRLLGSPRAEDELVFTNVESLETRYIPAGAVDQTVIPGNVIDTTLEWTGNEPRLADFTVVDETSLAFVDGVSNLFEAALDTWQEAQREDLAVNARVVHDERRDPAGAVYTFAEQGGNRDVFAELRDGSLPLEPIIERVKDAVAPPYEIFVMRPIAHQFVLVFVVLTPGSTLAETVQDTYGVEPISTD